MARTDMEAIILAAGLGWRLGGGEEQPPKCLLRFGGRTLLQRHLDALGALGIDRVHLGTGYRADDVAEELRRIAPGVAVDTVFNPDFQDGNIVTLHTLGHVLRAGRTVLLMDADVLYHADVLASLVASAHENCLLLDREFEPGEEPVKLCLRDGRPVEFGKQIPAGLAYDQSGESVGFFKLAPAMACRLAERTEAYLAAGRRDAFYEDALRDLMLESPQMFGHEDITGLPWIEIDFQEDIRRAEHEVLAHINAREAA